MFDKFLLITASTHYSWSDRRVLRPFWRQGVTFFPVNFWETLLLLSNWDRGVKFIYGDVDDYAHLLARVLNLLVANATGHRLQPLDRGDASGNTV